MVYIMNTTTKNSDSSPLLARLRTCVVAAGLTLLWGACSSGSSNSSSAGGTSLSTDPSRAGQLAEVQRAINAAAAGDVILFGPGDFVGRLVVRKSITLVGTGSDTVLRGNLSSTDAAIEIDGTADVEIRELAVAGAHAGIRIRGCQRVRLEAVFARDNLTEGVDVRQSTDVIVSGCDVRSNIGHGVRTREASLGVQIVDCTIVGNLDQGVEVIDSADVSVTTSLIRDNAQSGVRLRDAMDVVIVDNDIEQNMEYGVRLRGSLVSPLDLRTANRLVGNQLGDVRVDT